MATTPMAAPKKRPVELHSEYFDDDCASEGMGESEDGDPVEDTNLHWIGHLVIWKMEISEISKVICFFFPCEPIPIEPIVRNLVTISHMVRTLWRNCLIGQISTPQHYSALAVEASLWETILSSFSRNVTQLSYTKAMLELELRALLLWNNSLLCGHWLLENYRNVSWYQCNIKKNM